MNIRTRPPSNDFQFSDTGPGVLPFSSVRTLPTPSWRRPPRLGAQSHKSGPLHIAAANEVLSLPEFLPGSLQIWGSHDLPLRFDISLEWLTELQKVLHLGFVLL